MFLGKSDFFIDYSLNFWSQIMEFFYMRGLSYKGHIVQNRNNLHLLWDQETIVTVDYFSGRKIIFL